MNIYDDFNSTFHPHWTRVVTGGGELSIANSVLRMSYDLSSADRYTDAQIDDYTMLAKKDYIWKPPLRMTVRARASHRAATSKSTEHSKNILRGTAGFGFWNKPFTMQGQWFTMPESIWFFYSAPPSNMALVPGIPGWGWKAQVVHGRRLGAIPRAVSLSAAALYGRASGNDKPALRHMQQFAGAHEAQIVEDMTEWHTYSLEWWPDKSIFWVDGKEILRAPTAPVSALGFVMWLDNEYAVATPLGELRFGKSKNGAQWLDVDSISIEHL